MDVDHRAVSLTAHTDPGSSFFIRQEFYFARRKTRRYALSRKQIRRLANLSAYFLPYS
jgi:hypothetical protein